MLLCRDIETVLAHTLIIDHVLNEVHDIELMAEHVKKPLLKIRETAKSSCLFNLMKSNGVMFALIEHLLCAKLLLRQQHHLIMHLTRSGMFTEHDAEHLIEHIVNPTEAALSA